MEPDLAVRKFRAADLFQVELLDNPHGLGFCCKADDLLDPGIAIAVRLVEVADDGSKRTVFLPLETDVVRSPAHLLAWDDDLRSVLAFVTHVAFEGYGFAVAHRSKALLLQGILKCAHIVDLGFPFPI